MKFSLRLNNDLPVSTYLQLATLAESKGFDQFWVSDDLFLRSAPVILTAVATATNRIQIGTCIVNPYTMNPAEMAMMAVTLDEVSGGRFNLGIASGASDFLDWVGIESPKPLTAVLETIAVLKRLFAGERAPYDGQFLKWNENAYLRFKPQREIPIYLGAMSPKMLHAIGAVADGGLPLLFPPEHYRNVQPLIEQGAIDAERDISDVDVAACIWCSIDEDTERAKDPLREKIAYYGHAMSPMILSQLGLQQSDFETIEHTIMVERDTEKAKSLVTDQMLQIGIAGTVEDVRNRIEGLVNLGVRHVSFGPPLGPDLAHAIGLIGDHIIPYFQDIN
ncbi:MAG: LLM class flavin-dependent oxidoreductase [Aggregatilineales bacterium]